MRKRLGLTQKQLANALDVASNYIYMMECGKKPITDAVRVKIEKLDRANYTIHANGSAVAINGSTATTHPQAATTHCPLCATKDREIDTLKADVARYKGIIDNWLQKGG